MTRVSQELRIKEINNDLKTMATLVEKQIGASMEALVNSDKASIHKIIKDDDKVDAMQRIIEEECIKFIATEQPLAKDLRRVFAASKITTDLERMADHAVDICKIALESNKENNLEIFDGLKNMEEKVRKMIDLAISSYIARDDEEAYEICKLDDEIDIIYRDIFKQLLIQMKNEDNIESKAKLLFVGKYLERIGDHVTNICEWTIFAVRGNYVDLNE